jgi:hypothetical protein
MEKSETESFRWYLCVQTEINKWSCVRSTYEKAMNPFFYGDEKPNTKAIPISKWAPVIFDPFILHKKVHPHLKISM